MAYDFWRLCTDSNGTPITCSGNSSPADIGSIKALNLDSSNGTPGTTGSGLSTLVGDIFPGELLTGNAMPHAIAVYVSASMMSPNVCTEAPAPKSDGTTSGGVFCEGAKIAMDPSVDVDALEASPAANSIMKTLQIYGGVIVDQTSCTPCMGLNTDIQTAPPDLTGLASNLLSHLWIYYGN